MGCTYSYDFTQCHTDPAENDFADYLNLDSSRVAAHVGDLRFSPTNEIVYLELYQDIPQSVKGKLEALLEEGYRVLIYSGNVDIICHHTGNVKTIQSLHWSGIEDYLATENQVSTYRVFSVKLGSLGQTTETCEFLRCTTWATRPPAT